MRLIPFVLLLTACSSTQVPVPPPAPQISLEHVGEYYAPHDTLYVRENDGRIEAILKRKPIDLRGVVFTETGARVGDENFVRRKMAAGTFRITPLRPLEELRSLALSATPPRQPDSLLKPDLVELQQLDPTIQYDIRYATTNNFASTVFYSSAHAFMQRPAAEAVLRASKALHAHGLGLLIHDAYRPWYVTKMFWEATPDSLKDFVADPAAGSRHNRGSAVDLTLYDLKTGNVIEMPSGYDEFSERAFPTYPGGTTRQRWYRELLRSTMEKEGFTVNEGEWWHFDYNGWRRYPVTNLTFEQLLH